MARLGHPPSPSGPVSLTCGEDTYTSAGKDQAGLAHFKQNVPSKGIRGSHPCDRSCLLALAHAH